MLSIFAAIGSLLGGPITAITGQIAGYFNNAKTVEATEFASMSAAEQAEFIALTRAQSDLNNAKVQNNASPIAHFMIFCFGMPPAIYLGGFYISAGIPWLGWHVDPLRGEAGATMMDIAKTIAESFFIYGGAVMLGTPIVRSLQQRLRG